MMFRNWFDPFVLAFAVVVLNGCASSKKQPVFSKADAEFSLLNSNGWRAIVSPTDEELAFERINWRPSFHEGIDRAHVERKPLLLWVMNGHPLGCT